MSEGKYGRLPRPKDRTKVTVSVGDVAVAPAHDKAAEWEEEGEAYRPHAKRAAPHEESMMAKLGRMAQEATGSISKPWARMMDDKDDE